MEESFNDGKTAVVIVPDDQLSLAIGREGQNARLGAKLTGWRIDIKSLTEAATESLNNLDHPAADPAIVGNEKLLEAARLVLAKKEAGRPITSEDYYNLDRVVGGVEGKIITARAAVFEEERKVRAEARKAIPEQAWSLDLEALDLPGRVHNLLLDAEVETVGALMMTLSLGDEAFLEIKGLGDKALEIVQEHLANFDGWEEVPEVEEVVAEVEEAVAEVGAEAEVAAVEEEAEEAVVEVEPEAETAVAEPEIETTVELEPEVVVEEVPAIPVIDDLSQPLVDPTPIKAPKKKKAEKPAVVIARPTTTPAIDPEEEKRRGRKGKQLILDEESGEVVVKRKRKGSRGRPEWEEYDLDEF